MELSIQRWRRLSVGVVTATLAVLLAGPAIAQQTSGSDRPATATAGAKRGAVYPLPWPDASPRRLQSGPGGKLWFIDRAGGGAWLASFDPEVRRFHRFRLGSDINADQLLIDSAGRIWFGAGATDYVGFYDAASERLEKFPLARYPGLTLGRLAGGVDGGPVWFSAADRSAVGTLRADGRQLQLMPIPGATAGPGELAVAEDGAVWMVLGGGNRLASFEPRSGVLNEFALPFEDARAVNITPNNEMVWVRDSGRGTLGGLDPRNGAYLEYRIPLSGSVATAASDGRGQIWLLGGSDGNTEMVAFDTRDKRFGTPVPLRAAAVGDDASIAWDPHSEALWLFTAAGLTRIDP